MAVLRHPNLTQSCAAEPIHVAARGRLCRSLDCCRVEMLDDVEELVEAGDGEDGTAPLVAEGGRRVFEA